MNRPDKSAECSAEVSQETLGGLAARGMAWTTTTVMVGRITGFVTNLILGWLLAPGDFGVYAIAIGISVIVLTLRSSGVHKLLIQRGSEYDQLAQPFARLSLIINVTAMLLLGLSGPLVAAYFESPKVVPLLWIIGSTMPLAVPAEILRARLAIELRFREIALVGAGTLLLTQGLTIALALRGFGPFSFAWPVAIMAALESLFLIRYVGRWPAGRSLDWKLVRELVGSASWIVLCGFAAAFIVHGSSLVVGRFTDATVTGLYYFGFQLTAAVYLFFSSSMQRVLMPTLSRLTAEPQRQGEAYLRSMRILTTVAAPACGLIVAVAAPMISFCWNGKWDRSIQVFQPLTTALPVYMITGVGTALLESRGLWRANTLLHFLSAAGTVTAAWIGATRGGLWEIALAVSVFRAGYGILHGICMTRLLERRSRDCLLAVLPPCALSGGLAWTLIGWVQGPLASWARLEQAIAMGVLYLLLISLAYAVFMRKRVVEVALTLRRLWPAQATEARPASHPEISRRPR